MSHTNRRRFLKQGTLATGLATLASMFGLTPFSPAQAAAASSGGFQTAQLTGTEAEGYRHHVLASHDYQRFREQVQQKYEGVLAIHEQAISVESISNQGNTAVLVHVPIAGGEGHSHYTATFQKGSFAIMQAIGGLFTLTPERNITAVVERNGAVVADVTGTPDGSVVHGSLYKPDGTKITLDGSTIKPDGICWWNCAANCVGSFGIPIILMGLALAICFAICAAIPSPLAPAAIIACAACISATIGGTVGIISYCITICWC